LVVAQNMHGMLQSLQKFLNRPDANAV
jgi:hypothetical protein